MTLIDPHEMQERPATTRSGLPTRLSHIPTGIVDVDTAANTYEAAWTQMRGVQAEIRRLASRPEQHAAEKADEIAYATARAKGTKTPDPRAHQRKREADLIDARARLRGEIAHVDNTARAYRTTFDTHRADIDAEAERRLDDATSAATTMLAALRTALDNHAEAARFARWADNGPTTPLANQGKVTVQFGDEMTTITRLLDIITDHVRRPRTTDRNDRPTYFPTGQDLAAGTGQPRHRRGAAGDPRAGG